MDEIRPSNRSKRQKQPEEGFWECSVCTYRNSPEAYKCDMCDIRKGTSTRKPRLNSQLVAQQAAQQFVPVAPPTKKERNSLGPELNSDFEFSDNSNQGNNSHFYEEPLSNNNSFDHTPETSDVVPESIKIEKQETEKLEKQNIKYEKHTKTEKKPKKINRIPKVKKAEKLERSEEKMSVTVNNVTVIITDYIPKNVKKERRTSTETNHHVDNSDNSSVSGGSNCAGEDLLIENHHH